MFQGTRFHLQPLNTRKGMYAIGVLLGSPHFGEVSFPARQLGGTDCKPQKGDHYRDRKKKRICLQCWGHRAGDLRVSPGLGRCPGEGNGNPLQYSCLGNPMDRGAWQATVHGVTKNWTRLSMHTGEGNGTPLQYSCLENPMGGGAWWAAVHLWGR